VKFDSKEIHFVNKEIDNESAAITGELPEIKLDIMEID